MNDKHILIVCPCSLRGNSIGLIKEFLPHFSSLKKEGYKVDLFDTNFFENHDSKKYEVDAYYSLKIGIKERIIRKIPSYRTRYAQKRVIDKFGEILNNNHFCFIVVYKVPSYVDEIVKISHSKDVRIALYPWGSEVLRAPESIESNLKIAYSQADFIVGFEDSNLLNKAMSFYNVPLSRIRKQKVFVKGVKYLMQESGKWNRKKMSELLGIPMSSYNIICGYSGTKAHRHKDIIEALNSIKSDLPEGYQLVFPMTYVASSEYVNELRTLCSENKLNAFFLTDYLSDEQVAYLHLLTDLYINIQQTDSGSAFMIESLYCGNQILVGKWLNYEQFEEFGVPYHVIESLNDLPNSLKAIFRHEKPCVTVPQKLKDKYAANKDFDLGAFWKGMIEG